jgi:CheY-like chemotaxis protein/nitrogen-specific signal transduction histidine kinase
VRDENERPSYFISQIQDISARKSAEQDAKTAKSTALGVADAKSRFLATMSHEIRTPMNGIIGMTELLSLSELSIEQNQYVQVVRDSGESLLRVLNDILDYSKVEAGKLDLESTDFELSGQVESVVALLAPQFKSKGVLLAIDIDTTIPPVLNGDAGRIRQILINLVGNALKFTPRDGSVRLIVSAEEQCSKLIIIRFTITDSGVGIAADVKHLLFQPFSQVDGSTTRKHGGTGLGLAICKQLVDLMDGEIGVETEAIHGASFWFTLPLREGRRTDQSTATPSGELGERRLNVRSRSERLLLAEDNGINALVAVKQFQQLGFEIVVVPNGREAVEAVQLEHYDLVFMDCHMPEMNGWNAARAIRNLASELQRRVPIIAMTADVQPADRQACLTAGMDDYISKPSSLADLRTVLERWLPSAVINDS